MWGRVCVVFGSAVIGGVVVDESVAKGTPLCGGWFSAPSVGLPAGDVG
jgi:hypothetical protein